MIEASILDILKADTVLKKLVSRYANSPAIFSDLAPEAAIEPNITVNITRYPADNLALHTFNMFIDYWDTNSSRVNARMASERIEYLLDTSVINTDARYSTIRIRFFSGGYVEEDDPRKVHYNQQFTIRACRKKWIDQL